MEYNLVAPCYFGVESSAAFDFKRIGASNIAITDGRVAFSGDAGIIAAANIESRCAERIMILLKSFIANTFDELFDGVSEVDWAYYLPRDASFPVKGSSLSSTLSSVPACQSIVKKAIVESLKKGHKTAELPESGYEYRVRFSIRKNLCEVFLDTTGVGLHKRGYRRDATEAPIKETLAAAMADLSHLRKDARVEDPFCGSGTLLIEAAQKAMRIAPGLRRRFAAEQYAFLPQDIFKIAREKALANIDKTAQFAAFGYDIDEAAIEIAKNNAKLAGVGDRVTFAVADVKDFAPAPEAIIITNPPYGERLGDAAAAKVLCEALSQRLKLHAVQGAYIITADADFEQHFGRPATKRRKLYNGMIPCQLYMYY